MQKQNKLNFADFAKSFIGENKLNSNSKIRTPQIVVPKESASSIKLSKHMKSSFQRKIQKVLSVIN